jgi:CheY-like chemotaxis protein
MNTPRGSLLVADDDEMNRDRLGRRLERRVYTVARAADGQQALSMLDTQTFDVVLLDIMMPGLSGLEPSGSSARAMRWQTCPSSWRPPKIRAAISSRL